MSESPRFFVRSRSDVLALGEKLKQIVFDQYSISIDRKGNPMIGLSKQISSRRIDYRGLVVVLNESLLPSAEKAVSLIADGKSAQLRAGLDAERAK